MKEQFRSVKFERKRRFLLVLPVIATPFIVFVLWILGIVGPAETMAQERRSAGLNLSLPSAVPSSDSTWDKLKFYEQADKDSAKMRKLQKQDPYFKKRKSVDELLKDSESGYRNHADGASSEADAQEKKVYERISAIHKEIERPASRPKPVIRKPEAPSENRLAGGGDVERLERMMQMMNNKEPEEDPEMQQINAMMEKIMDVQHPERVQERMKKEEMKPKVFAVQLTEPVNEVTLVETNRFYSLSDETAGEQVANTIAAVVQEDQMLQAGCVVKFRLRQTVFVNGVEIPENGFVYGVASVSKYRMLVNVSNIQYQGTNLPVALGVYGADGMKGIPVQSIDLQQAMGETMDKSLQTLGTSALDMSAGSQVAGAVLQAGKSLLKKQHKAVSVMIPAGYPVTLVNNSSNN